MYCVCQGLEIVYLEIRQFVPELFDGLSVVSEFMCQEQKSAAFIFMFKLASNESSYKKSNRKGMQ